MTGARAALPIYGQLTALPRPHANHNTHAQPPTEEPRHSTRMQLTHRGQAGAGGACGQKPWAGRAALPTQESRGSASSSLVCGGEQEGRGGGGGGSKAAENENEGCL